MFPNQSVTDLKRQNRNHTQKPAEPETEVDESKFININSVAPQSRHHTRRHSEPEEYTAQGELTNRCIKRIFGKTTQPNEYLIQLQAGNIIAVDRNRFSSLTIASFAQKKSPITLQQTSQRHQSQIPGLKTHN